MFVPVVIVHLHSDAYLRSLTLSHKIGGEQNVLDQYNLAKNVLDQFFSLFFFALVVCSSERKTLHTTTTQK